ncbi:MAG: flagellar basal body L-ring protein FlgH [Phycisphaerae bacterium]|nr:flagellar basal body L-ring protein FlgH [Phycisphaerae bacterium]
MRVTLAVFVLTFGPVGWAAGQSSSLFKRCEARRAAERAATTQPSGNGSLPVNAGAANARAMGGNTALAEVSLTAIRLPEPKVIKVHDFIGVIVRYQVQHQSSSKLEQESEWDANAKLEAWFRLHDRKWTDQGFRAGKPEVKFANKNELENEGKADRKDKFETRLMAKVIDVKPNGNLVIVGWSKMGIDKEEQYIRLTGECNRDHITADGNITSDKIFGLDVVTMNKGAVRDAVKRGLFKEFLDDWKLF